MRLINTSTLELEEVNGSADREYAILSHTWRASGEPSFQDVQQHGIRPQFDKIRETCRIAKGQGLSYAWVDNCCIDKTSSAELTEAINSMFRWYKESKVCIAYLEDLTAGNHGKQTLVDLEECRWFKRGWTLQELIAPTKLEFFDAEWTYRGSKASLSAVISAVTGIDQNVLRDSSLLPTIAVARRMSWAADRQTTRIEDRAYSLFGLFDVNLPLIYGEAEKSFVRLQEAIAQESNDLSLFAWTVPDRPAHIADQLYWGAFAPSPSFFASCHKIQLIDDPTLPPVEFAITNRGVRFQLRLRAAESPGGIKDFVLGLRCFDDTRSSNRRRRPQIFIRLLRYLHGFVRHHGCEMHLKNGVEYTLKQGSRRYVFYLTKTLSLRDSSRVHQKLSQRFYITVDNDTIFSATDLGWQPAHLWHRREKCFETDGSVNFRGAFELSINGGKYNDDPIPPKPRLGDYEASDRWHADENTYLRELFNRRRSTAHDYMWPSLSIEIVLASRSQDPSVRIHAEEQGRRTSADPNIPSGIDSRARPRSSQVVINGKNGSCHMLVVPVVDTYPNNGRLEDLNEPPILKRLPGDALRLTATLETVEGEVASSCNLLLRLEREPQPPI